MEKFREMTESRKWPWIKGWNGVVMNSFEEGSKGCKRTSLLVHLHPLTFPSLSLPPSYQVLYLYGGQRRPGKVILRMKGNEKDQENERTGWTWRQLTGLGGRTTGFQPQRLHIPCTSQLSCPWASQLLSLNFLICNTRTMIPVSPTLQYTC